MTSSALAVTRGLRLRALLAALSLLVAPGLARARGGGGCLEEGTRVATPLGEVPVEALRPGAPVWAVVGGRLQAAAVLAVTRVEPEEYVELSAGGAVLRVTPEHPMQIGAGLFRTAERLEAGATLFVREGERVSAARLQAVRRVRADRPAYNLLVQPGGTFLANGVAVHNKGCFLPDTPITRADGTQVAIADVRPGDALLAFTPEGEVVTTTVRDVITHEVGEYVELETEHTALRVTAEHPFFVGGGTFATVDALRVGDTIHVLSAGGLRPERIVALRAVRAPVRVYNLQTDRPNTYFASGVAVHNKGGGGCFLPETPVTRADGSAVAIGEARPGDRLLAFTPDGAVVTTQVHEVLVHDVDAYVVLTTARGQVRVTAEHPLFVGEGRFVTVAALKVGDRIYGLSEGRLVPERILAMEEVHARARVYNLHTDEPHTFIAGGLAVHNKGGGGFHSSGGHYGGSRSSGGSGGCDGSGVIFFLIIFGIFIAVAVANAKKKENQDLDFSYSRGQIEAKAGKTEKLLEFLAKVDGTVAPTALRMQARTTFLKLQQCWEAREYEPMRALMMPDLWQQHAAQLAGMKLNHEIDRIADLRVDAVDLVNVRYPYQENQREFTALITATARDHYVDDRTGAFLRGDTSPAQFQEFWTFQRKDGAWLLREVEQTRESDALKDENFFEQFTDVGRDRVYGEAAGKEGPAGPWLEKAVETKATKIERLLAFLAQTDKLWDRQAMLERARKVFLDVTLSREQGDPAAIPADELFPDVAAALRAEVEGVKARGLRYQFRNLCVRKVELILVRNFADNTRDEFTVRISAHAQRGVERGGVSVHQDADVTPFTQYWTFGRLDGQWRLKESLPEARGEEAMRAENLDEDSSPEQVQWYYKQTRAK
jgi:predicted lipid-binding transport protein (Tim44 family)